NATAFGRAHGSVGAGAPDQSRRPHGRYAARCRQPERPRHAAPEPGASPADVPPAALVYVLQSLDLSCPRSCAVCQLTPVNSLEQSGNAAATTAAAEAPAPTAAATRATGPDGLTGGISEHEHAHWRANQWYESRPVRGVEEWPNAGTYSPPSPPGAARSIT